MSGSFADGHKSGRKEETGRRILIKGGPETHAAQDRGFCLPLPVPSVIGIFAAGMRSELYIQI